MTTQSNCTGNTVVLNHWAKGTSECCDNEGLGLEVIAQCPYEGERETGERVVISGSYIVDGAYFTCQKCGCGTSGTPQERFK